MNRQSNTYTIIYSIVLVLVVGVVLSVVYQALRPMQVENINNDTKRQILAAARIVPEKRRKHRRIIHSAYQGQLPRGHGRKQGRLLCRCLQRQCRSRIKKAGFRASPSGL